MNHTGHGKFNLQALTLLGDGDGGAAQLTSENPLKHLISTEATRKIAFSAPLVQPSPRRLPVMVPKWAMVGVC